MKVCPVCKSRCFDDMEVCYGCMHQFNRPKIKEQDIPKVAKHAEADPMPEFFEVEEYPIVEDIETFMLRQTDDLANLWESEEPSTIQPSKHFIHASESPQFNLGKPTMTICKDSININFKIL